MSVAVTIPYARQSVDDDDIAAVTAVLRGDWLTQGPHVETFERTLAGMVGARFCVAFSSATAGLHAAVAAAGIGPGDRVVTSPCRSWPAPTAPATPAPASSSPTSTRPP
jgi:perosamine synthetase